MGIERFGGYENTEQPEKTGSMHDRWFEAGRFGDGPGGPRGDGGADRGWNDRGVIDVPIQDLPAVLDINGPEDFEKVPVHEMMDGMNKLNDTIRPALEQGQGATTDYWRSYDQQLNLDYEHGYQKIFEAFYGQGAVKLYKTGDVYDIDSGRHRVWLAQRMGMESIPAHVKERI